MNHLAYLDPPIEVLAAGARLEMILSRLRSGRMRPFGADLPISHSSSEALLVDTQSLDKDTLGQFIDDFGQSLRPTLILGDPVFAGHFANAVFIPRDRDLSVLRGRLDAITRRSPPLRRCRTSSISEMGLHAFLHCRLRSANAELPSRLSSVPILRQTMSGKEPLQPSCSISRRNLEACISSPTG